MEFTYRLNDRDIPLLPFLVVDGNSRLRTSGFYFIVNETGQMLDCIFILFRSINTASH